MSMTDEKEWLRVALTEAFSSELASRVVKLWFDPAALPLAEGDRAIVYAVSWLMKLRGMGYITDKPIATRLEQLEAEVVELRKVKASAVAELVRRDVSALGPNPSVSEIVQDYLKRNGYSDIRATKQTWFGRAGFWHEAGKFHPGYLQPNGSIGPEKE